MEAERQYGEMTLESAAAEAAAAQPDIPAVSYGVPCPYVDKPIYEAVKRGFDIILAIVGLVLTSPIMLAAAIAIKAEDGGPVIYKRKCVGLHGKPFTMYKFRSMVVGADELIDIVFTPEQKEKYAVGDKLPDDPRITKVGQVIRRISADELPQLVCILKNDMSLIGPRPVTEGEAKVYGRNRDKLLCVKPGITGYWQVYGRADRPYLSKETQDLQLHYVDHYGFPLDSKLFFMTFKVILTGKGAK